MDWKDVASVDLPSGVQIGDLLGVVDQLEMQVKAALSPKASAVGAPRVKCLAPVVDDAFAALIEARDALKAAEAKRATHAPVADGAETAAANTAADDAWRAMERLLAAGRALPDDERPGRDDAEALYARLFDAEGLSFITHRPRRQWDVSQRLVAVLREPEASATVEALGGKRHLRALLKAHQDFGAAFGFSKPTAVTPAEVTSTRAEQLTLQAALREYLVKVAAQVSPRIEGSAELCRFLLAPYAEMAEDLARAPKPAKKPPEKKPAEPETKAETPATPAKEPEAPSE